MILIPILFNVQNPPNWNIQECIVRDINIPALVCPLEIIHCPYPYIMDTECKLKYKNIMAQLCTDVSQIYDTECNQLIAQYNQEAGIITNSLLNCYLSSTTPTQSQLCFDQHCQKAKQLYQQYSLSISRIKEIYERCIDEELINIAREAKQECCDL